MGRQHRVTQLAWVALTVMCCACTERVDQKALMRQEVLRANDLSAERRKASDANRTTDDYGNLLASTQRVAGVTLPRGFELKYTFDHEWYYDGGQSYAKLVKYFTESLDYAGVEQPSRSKLTFVQARNKGDSEMKPVRLTVSAVPGRNDWSRIQIAAQQPLPAVRQTKAEIDAELSVRRKYSH
jgi:hypothetical protein